MTTEFRIECIFSFKFFFLFNELHYAYYIYARSCTVQSGQSDVFWPCVPPTNAFEDGNGRAVKDFGTVREALLLRHKKYQTHKAALERSTVGRGRGGAKVHRDPQKQGTGF